MVESNLRKLAVRTIESQNACGDAGIPGSAKQKPETQGDWTADNKRRPKIRARRGVRYDPLLAEVRRIIKAGGITRGGECDGR